MKDGVFQRNVFPLAIGKNLLKFAFKAFPFLLAPKVIHHQKAAVEQIRSKGFAFFFFEVNTAGLNEIDKWIVEKPWISQFNDHAVRIGMH